jgi:hypothetical protein
MTITIISSKFDNQAICGEAEAGSSGTMFLRQIRKSLTSGGDAWPDQEILIHVPMPHAFAVFFLAFDICAEMH